MARYSAVRAETFSVKVGKDFAERYRDFCDRNCLQVGRFTEQALSEIMEDYYFGKKAQAILSRTTGKAVAHATAFSKPKSPRR